ncbi:MAG: ACT domain-containing protein [Vampirovibrionales bacterium]|nr:ACT domain-containing protein [Vampirovibrionales bacterium]
MAQPTQTLPESPVRPLALTSAVITAAGPDKPGITATLTSVLAEFNCNIEDATMTRLGTGDNTWFAVIIRASAAHHQDWALLEQALRTKTEPYGMRPQVSPVAVTRQTGAGAPNHAEDTAMISVSGADCAGITHAVTQALADAQLNITDLSAQVIPGESGPVYLMMIEVSLPETYAITQLQSMLSPLSTKLGVEVSARRLDVATF